MTPATPTLAQFWLLTGNAPKGPFTLVQIQAKLASGEATWGSKLCPLGESEWRPLHRVPGIIPEAQRLPAAPASKAQPVRTLSRPIPNASVPSSAPAIARTRSLPANRKYRYALIGVGVLAIFGIGYALLRTSLTDAAYERGYADTVLIYADRPYEGAKWTKLKETSSFSEMVSLGSSAVADLWRVAGWDDNNLWVANQSGQVFQLREGHWQFAARPEYASYPRLRVFSQDTVFVAGCSGAAHLYQMSPGNVADQGDLESPREAELYLADRGLIYCYRDSVDPVRFAEGTRTVLKAEHYKEAFVHRKDNTLLKEYPVGMNRHVRSIRPGIGFAVAKQQFGSKKKLVRFEAGLWVESADLPDKDFNDLWLSGTDDAPHVVLVGKGGWVHVQPAGNNGAERALATSAEPTPANLIKVWGHSPEKFWVMDENGTVWEMNRTESRIVVRGLRREDVTFKDAWVSPTGTVFAITNKHLYRLD